MKITSEQMNEFVDYLFETPPYKAQFIYSNKEGFKKILKEFFEVLYSDIPKDVINYLETNASSYFLDLLYRESGISDYFIKRIPQALKLRLSYLLNVLKVQRTTYNVFKLFHEALEEFYPKMNIYLIEIMPKDLNAPTVNLEYKLNPVYITDDQNILDYVTESDLSGTFLMRPEQFIDREEKFSNIYTDDKSKRRVVNIFPIKTGMIYIQNPSGLGVADYDDYIPLMQMIGASLQRNDTIPWKIDQSEVKKNIPFVDFIKLCSYLKYKEFQFKSQNTWTWYTEPLEIYDYRNSKKLKEWNDAQIQAYNTGLHWSTFYKSIDYKLNDMILDDTDLAEAIRLEEVYRGLKRSGLNNGRQNLNQFKTDWNTLRQKPQNVSIRKITNLKEFRDELVGTEPYSVIEFELLILEKFSKTINGTARDNIFSIRNKYQTNKLNTLDEKNGLITLVLKHLPNTEINDFILGKYKDFVNIEKNETLLLLDLLDWYIRLGTIPLLKHYYYIKSTKFPELLVKYSDDPLHIMNSKNVYNSLYSELTNNTNINNFIELNNIIKPKYRAIIEQIDYMLDPESESELEDFTMIFLNLWKIIQVNIKDDKRIRYFWNDFFMRHIMGATFKDYFYDPIIELFLEYWFPAETTTQNKDISTLLIKDKMNSIPLESRKTSSYTMSRFDTLTQKDQNRLTVIKKDGTEKIYENMFKYIKEDGLNFIFK